MKKSLMKFSFLAITGLCAPQISRAGDVASLIGNAESAAPAAISSAATIYAFEKNGSLKLLRPGSNGYWCVPDDPATADEDPICGDQVAMDWLLASRYSWSLPKDKVGIAFVRTTGTQANDYDLYSSGPAQSNHWVKAGSHVFIVLNDPNLLATAKSPSSARLGSLAYAIRNTASRQTVLSVN